MRYMLPYDLMETARNTNEWIGGTARALASYPAFAMTPNPSAALMAAWGEVTERTFRQMIVKPSWNLFPVLGEDGKDHTVRIKHVIKRPFGDLIHFNVNGLKNRSRRVLLIPPMSGHYATLARSTVASLLPDADVYLIDWHNARDIPVSMGKFDVEDYTRYVIDYIKTLGNDTHVIAVCQPVPLALAATAYLSEHSPEARPASLTLIGGPVDPDAAPTEVTDFGHSMTMGALHEMMIQRVGFKYPGVGRMVYPGLLQLISFISMNLQRHTKAFSEQISRVAQDLAFDNDRHNRFYDEYLAVMDMPAEFYLSTVERIFKNREIGTNDFYIEGTHCDISKITDVPVIVIEGENDDISAPGQCRAALDLLSNLPEARKLAHLEPGAGHYSIFAGRQWRHNIRPLVLDFIDKSQSPHSQISSSRGKAA